MSDSTVQDIIDGDIPTKNDNKILSISNMKTNTLYMLSDRKRIATRNGDAMIGTFTDVNTDENDVVFLPKSLIRKVENCDNNYHIVIVGKVQMGNYKTWDIRVRKLE